MFDHVDIAVSDLDASRRFYTLALGEPTADDEWLEWGDFGITPVSAEHPLTRRLHVGCGGVDGRSDGGEDLLDPDGNSIEAGSRSGGLDHVRLDTCDVAAARRFYETIAPAVGIRLVHDHPEHVRFTGGAASLSLVASTKPTENVHLAFGVDSVGAVAEFHRLALVGGYRDNGAPGERPQYHPGYHAAFVLDADGHNVEAVCHSR